VVRFARVVALDVAHPITQRGNARRFILETDAERGVYLDLLQQGIQRHGVELIGYCLMSNHIHLIAVPQNKDALARSLKQHMADSPLTGMQSTIPAGMCGRGATIPALLTRRISGKPCAMPNSIRYEPPSWRLRRIGLGLPQRPTAVLHR
jgi:hypothetical protein